MCTTRVQLALAAGSVSTGAATGEPTAYAVAALVVAATAARCAVRRRWGPSWAVPAGSLDVRTVVGDRSGAPLPVGVPHGASEPRESGLHP